MAEVGCTAVVAVVETEDYSPPVPAVRKLWVANAGDSRAVRAALRRGRQAQSRPSAWTASCHTQVAAQAKVQRKPRDVVEL